MPCREGEPTSPAALSELFYLGSFGGKHGCTLILGKSRGRGVACDSSCCCPPLNCLSARERKCFSPCPRAVCSVWVHPGISGCCFCWLGASWCCREPRGETRGSCCGWFPVQDGSRLGQNRPHLEPLEVRKVCFERGSAQGEQCHGRKVPAPRALPLRLRPLQQINFGFWKLMHSLNDNPHLPNPGVCSGGCSGLGSAPSPCPQG